MKEGSFRDLKIWQNGYELVMKINDITKTFPDYERFALVTQIHKSSNSVIANIAEANGRFYYLDKIRCLYISRGELDETRSHFSVAFGLRYLSKDEFDELEDSYVALSKSLNQYINYLYSESNSKGNEKRNS